MKEIIKDNTLEKDFWGQNDNDSNNGENNKNNQNKRSSGPHRPNTPKPWFILIIVSLVFFVGWHFFQNTLNKVRTTSYSRFLNAVKSGTVQSVNINNAENIEYTLKGSIQDGQSLTYVTRIPYYDSELITLLSQHNVEVVGTEKQPSLFEMILTFLPTLMLIFIMFIWIRQASKMGNGGFLSGMGKNHAHEYDKNSKKKITFADVAGQVEAKQELEEIVQFLKNPKKFKAIGARIPKGVLLVGPPGTGKTLIARAVAGESGVSFLHTSGSDFVEMFVGMGASRVRDLFAQGKKKAPCIIFIDELDAVGRARGTGLGGGHDEREQTLNQILVEMDGFENETGVIVMAATNRPDVLDSALLRPGRFDRQVTVGLPDIKEREAILKIHFKNIKKENELDYAKIAAVTQGCSGADLANLANEAALLAARADKPFVTMTEIEEARDKIYMGVARKSHVVTPEDKTLTAYHEAGHALLHYYVPHSEPLHKVTVIPRGSAGGVTWSYSEKEKMVYTKDELLARIQTAMGGFVAEEIVFGVTSTGPSSDIKMSMQTAQRMVTEWGMSSLGFVNYSDDGTPTFLGRDIAHHKNISDSTSDLIDKEVRKILDDCLTSARNILKEHRDQLDKLSQALIERETLEDKDVRELLGFESAVDKAKLIDG